MIPTYGHRYRLRIGILGGSFNPAHQGHLHIARQALRHAGLDQLWLMVSPANPLKPAAGMAPLPTRLASAAAIADGRRIVATDIEARLHLHYTADTLAMLRRRFPRADFIWLMGADNLIQLPRWSHWRRIVHTMPLLVMPRPGTTRAALSSRAAHTYARHRLPARATLCLPAHQSPAWIMLPVRENAASATALRAAAAQPDHIPTQRTAPITRPPTRQPPAPRGADPARPKLAAKARAPKAAAGDKIPAPPGTPRKKASIAGPRRKKNAERPLPAEDLDRMQSLIMASLEDDKAEEVVAIDLAGRASFADRMVIATGLADRQIAAMATHLNEKLVEGGFKKARMEGAGGTDWVLIDAGDIIVHLFKPEARTLYGLEKMWSADLDEG